jgi:hypothetical protein
MTRLPQGLKALKQATTQVGADLRGASLNLDGGCNAARHRTGVFPAGLIPNIAEVPQAQDDRVSAQVTLRRGHPCVADTGRTDLSTERHLPAVVAPC